MDQSIVLEEQLDETYEPGEDEIREYANWLGMDPESEKDLLWIAREGLKAPLPPDWKPCRTLEGDIYYFNFTSGESTWDHPCDQYYRKMYAEQKARLQQHRSQHAQERVVQPQYSPVQQQLDKGQNALLAGKSQSGVRLLGDMRKKALPNISDTSQQRSPLSSNPSASTSRRESPSSLQVQPSLFNQGHLQPQGDLIAASINPVPVQITSPEAQLSRGANQGGLHRQHQQLLPPRNSSPVLRLQNGEVSEENKSNGWSTTDEEEDPRGVTNSAPRVPLQANGTSRRVSDEQQAGRLQQALVAYPPGRAAQLAADRQRAALQAQATLQAQAAQAAGPGSRRNSDQSVGGERPKDPMQLVGQWKSMMEVESKSSAPRRVSTAKVVAALGQEDPMMSLSGQQFVEIKLGQTTDMQRQARGDEGGGSDLRHAVQGTLGREEAALLQAGRQEVLRRVQAHLQQEEAQLIAQKKAEMEAAVDRAMATEKAELRRRMRNQAKGELQREAEEFKAGLRAEQAQQQQQSPSGEAALRSQIREEVENELRAEMKAAAREEVEEEFRRRGGGSGRQSGESSEEERLLSRGMQDMEARVRQQIESEAVIMQQELRNGLNQMLQAEEDAARREGAARAQREGEREQERVRQQQSQMLEMLLEEIEREENVIVGTRRAKMVADVKARIQEEEQELWARSAEMMKERIQAQVAEQESRLTSEARTAMAGRLRDEIALLERQNTAAINETRENLAQQVADMQEAAKVRLEAAQRELEEQEESARQEMSGQLRDEEQGARQEIVGRLQEQLQVEEEGMLARGRQELVERVRAALRAEEEQARGRVDAEVQKLQEQLQQEKEARLQELREQADKEVKQSELERDSQSNEQEAERSEKGQQHEEREAQAEEEREAEYAQARDQMEEQVEAAIAQERQLAYAHARQELQAELAQQRQVAYEQALKQLADELREHMLHERLVQFGRAERQLQEDLRNHIEEKKQQESQAVEAYLARELGALRAEAEAKVEKEKEAVQMKFQEKLPAKKSPSKSLKGKEPAEGGQKIVSPLEPGNWSREGVERDILSEAEELMDDGEMSDTKHQRVLKWQQQSVASSELASPGEQSNSRGSNRGTRRQVGVDSPPWEQLKGSVQAEQSSASGVGLEGHRSGSSSSSKVQQESLRRLQEMQRQHSEQTGDQQPRDTESEATGRRGDAKRVHRSKENSRQDLQQLLVSLGLGDAMGTEGAANGYRRSSSDLSEGPGKEPLSLVTKTQAFLSQQKAFLRERQMIIEQAREEWRRHFDDLEEVVSPTERQKKRTFLLSLRITLEDAARALNEETRSLRAIKRVLRYNPSAVALPPDEGPLLPMLQDVAEASTSPQLRKRPPDSPSSSFSEDGTSGPSEAEHPKDRRGQLSLSKGLLEEQDGKRGSGVRGGGRNGEGRRSQSREHRLGNGTALGKSQEWSSPDPLHKRARSRLQHDLLAHICCYNTERQIAHDLLQQHSHWLATFREQLRAVGLSFDFRGPPALTRSTIACR